MRSLVTMRGNIHPLARPEFDRGVAPDDLPMERMLLVLKRGADQEASLRELLDQQQVNSSSQFHQWLTPEQFGQQYGPADSDVQAVTAWLSSQGFEVRKIAAGRTVIEFSGSAGMVRQVLGTEIHKFHVNGMDRWANATDPQIPAALAPVVAGIVSLNNFPRKPLFVSPLTPARRQQAAAKGMPLFTFPTTCSDGTSGCYYLGMGPGDFAKIYNVSPLWNATPSIDGKGVAIGVVGETNINIQDARDFRSMFGLPANDPQIILNGPDPGILTNGEETEAALDVEWAGGVAKGATIDFVVSQSTETTAGVDLSALYIVDNNLAPILSESYGGCEAALGTSGNAFYSSLWQQAAAQGITVILASGDSGSAGCDSANAGDFAAQSGLGVSGFASTPFNVAVGGTDFNINNSNVATYWSQFNGAYQASALGYMPEMTWNYSCADAGVLTGCTPPPDSSYLDAGVYLSAGGGGASQAYAKPAWQTGTGVPNDGARDVPDVSLVGSGYYIICQRDVNGLTGGSSSSCDLNDPNDFQFEGGTSASAQAFAGVMAMVDQAHGRQGNANYVLYPLAAGANTCVSNASAAAKTTCIFYDTQVGNNSVICLGGSPNCSNNVAGQYGIVVSKGAAAYATTAGFDLATGLGSVNVANLVNHWKSTFTPDSITLSLTAIAPATLTTLVHGQPVNFSINVSSGGGTPTGDASLIAQTGSYSNGNGGAGIGPFTLSAGSAAGSTIMLPGGSYSVTAHYAGNGTFGSSDSSPGIPVTVLPESSKTIIRLATPGATTPVYNVTTVNYGSPYILRMDVTNSSAQPCAPADSSGEQFGVAYPCPTGSLTVTPAPIEQNPPSGSTAGSYKLNTQGYAEDQPIQLPPGVYNFAASYSGDNSYAASGSPTLPVTITTAPTSTTLIASPSSGSAMTLVAMAVTVTTQSNGAQLGGTVQLYKNGVPYLTPVPINNGTAVAGQYVSGQTTLYGMLPAGSLNLSAQYSGDTNYQGSTSPAVPVTITDFSVGAAPPTINIASPGQSGTSVITVTPLGGFTGTVTFSLQNNPCPTGATCTLSPSPITLTNATAVTTTLTVTTTGAAAAPPAVYPRPKPPFNLLYALKAWTALLLIALLAFGSRRRWRRYVAYGTTAVFVGSLWIACGGGGGTGGGGGGHPIASLSANTITFDNQNVGSTSSGKSVTLTNSGTGSLSISSITLGGSNGSDFAESTTCGGILVSGSSCTISASFAPTAKGSRAATITITDDGSGSPRTINLTGTGTLPATPSGSYSITLRATSGDNFHDMPISVVVQ